MKNYFFLFLIALFFTTTVRAQDSVKRERVVQDVKATEVVASRGSSPDLTELPAQDSAVDDTDCSCGCYVTFDNYTGYWINIYVDSVFKGIIDPYGVGELWVIPSVRKYYAETTGHTYYWTAELGCNSADQYIKFRE